MAGVPAKGKFIGIFWQMLAGNMMPGSDHASLEQGEKGLRSIGGSRRTVRILAPIFSARVIDGRMFLPVFQGAPVSGMLSGVDDGFLTDAFSQCRAEIFPGDRSHHLHAGQPQAFDGLRRLG